MSWCGGEVWSEGEVMEGESEEGWGGGVKWEVVLVKEGRGEVGEGGGAGLRLDASAPPPEV